MISENFPQITRDLFELGTMVSDALKHRNLLYCGYSNWALGVDEIHRRGSYKFLAQARSGNFYTMYLSPEYVEKYVNKIEGMNNDGFSYSVKQAR